MKKFIKRTAACFMAAITVMSLSTEMIKSNSDRNSVSAASLITVQAPLRNKSITSYFNENRTIYGVHYGLDMCSSSLNVYAPVDGEVVYVSNKCKHHYIKCADYGNYGNCVFIKSVIGGKAYIFRLGHLEYNSIQVKKGQKVSAGQIVAVEGSTGNCSGRHTHLEVRVLKSLNDNVMGGTLVNVNPTSKNGGKFVYKNVLKPYYKNTLVDKAYYKISPASNSNLFIGRNSKTNNVELVNSSDASAVWQAHYSAETDSFYFTPKNNSKIVLNISADVIETDETFKNIQTKFNCNTYSKFIKNDMSQKFIVRKNSSGGYNILSATNIKSALETVSNKKGGNIRSNVYNKNNKNAVWNIVKV